MIHDIFCSDYIVFSNFIFKMLNVFHAIVEKENLVQMISTSFALTVFLSFP